ncbi:hypothetical protein JCM5350_002916 [Sporobolomyces pararoseus]
MEDTLQARSLAYFDTEYSADSIEFCPSIPNLFVCGTYQVDQHQTELNSTAAAQQTEENDGGEGNKPEVVRTGRCYLFKIDRNGNNLKELQRIETPAILDMKWSPRPWNGYDNVLAIADAKGHVQLYSLDQETLQLSLIDIVTVSDESTLCLSLDWSTRHPSAPEPATIIVSLSNGSLAHLTPPPPPSTSSTSSSTPPTPPTPPPTFVVSKTWHAHDFEPWIVSFDCWNWNNFSEKTVWSGGDDLKLKGWKIPQDSDNNEREKQDDDDDEDEEEEEEGMEPTFVNKRFEGGVTTITSHPLVENLIAVGSYDGQVRLFDKRNPLKPLTSFDVGGGIWRLKWHPSNPQRLLIAAMHNGFSVIDFKGLVATTNVGEGGNLEPGEGELVKRFEGHESLAYGVDWNQGNAEQTEDGKDLVASCSFYDHALHVWSV